MSKLLPTGTHLAATTSAGSVKLLQLLLPKPLLKLPSILITNEVFGPIVSGISVADSGIADSGNDFDLEMKMTGSLGVLRRIL
jgi:hypothetical protein